MALVLGIYSGFIYERKGNITIETNLPARVFDIHQSVGGLEVSYGGENLRESKKTLWFVSITIKNNGNAVIKNGDYDGKIPLGLRIDGGQIVDTQSLKTSTDYLKENLQIKLNSTMITFSPIIFEPKDYISLNLLILGPENKKPIIHPIGKIAGISNIELINIESGEDSKSWWQRVIGSDSWFIQLSRTVIYFFVFILSMLVIISTITLVIIQPIDSLKNKQKENKRRAQTDKFGINEDISKESRYLIDEYIRNGKNGLFRVKKCIDTINDRNSFVMKLPTSITDSDKEKMSESAYPVPYDCKSAFTNLITRELIPRSPDNAIITITDKLSSEANKLLAFLDISDNDYLDFIKQRNFMSHGNKFIYSDIILEKDNSKEPESH